MHDAASDVHERVAQRAPVPRKLISLYRRVLRANCTAFMSNATDVDTAGLFTLGLQYARSEFEAHRDASGRQLDTFIDAWDQVRYSSC